MPGTAVGDVQPLDPFPQAALCPILEHMFDRAVEFVAQMDVLAAEAGQIAAATCAFLLTDIFPG